MGAGRCADRPQSIAPRAPCLYRKTLRLLATSSVATRSHAGDRRRPSVEDSRAYAAASHAEGNPWLDRLLAQPGRDTHGCLVPHADNRSPALFVLMPWPATALG